MTVPVYDTAAIEAIGSGLLERTLPKAAWTHAAHLAAAVWMIRCRPDLQPEQDLPDIIRAYNAATGVPNSDTSGYHETITQASLQVIRHELATLPPTAPVASATAHLLASRYGDRGWLAAHWTPARLFSPAARRYWMAPDLVTLPGTCTAGQSTIAP